MTRKLKPADIPLEEDVQAAILSMTLLTEEGTPTTLGNLVKEALRNLSLANSFLKNSPLIKITAENLMRVEKKRGSPTLRVSEAGEILLRISWGEEEEGEVEEAPQKLPSLDSLRERAKLLGVDISDLGRQKHNILKRIKEIEKQ